ncbi:kinase-like protein [Myriangium duriaei CBS 260.36]|uniref:Kinase-like protein n=1 Tax=Myriangium duriaei CBS 260.36 TaxID=1168546 RepID=A0A9P4IYZ4_9PEZI|nr:kinase-like protein [Myriangium duriaei CBS 260.36]
MSKRKLTEQEAAEKPSKVRTIRPDYNTPAAKWNRGHFSELQKLMMNDPEADMRMELPLSYSRTLLLWKDNVIRTPAQAKADHKPHPKSDPRLYMDATGPCNVIHAPSSTLESLLPIRDTLSEAIIDLLDAGEVLHTFGSRMVLRVGPTVVAKISCTDRALSAEYEALVYLAANLPSLPVPKPHGMVDFGPRRVLFTDFVPGQTMEATWPSLSVEEKIGLSKDLDRMFVALRELPMPEGEVLGSLDGSGCVDNRRFERRNEEPIVTVKEFVDHYFQGYRGSAPTYTKLMRSLLPGDAEDAKVVFTHSDLRPANIMVQRIEGEEGKWEITGVIDWESSGWYPEWWEAAKMTNCMIAGDRWNWYEYLPECCGPTKYSGYWLLDRVWDRTMQNS